MRSLVLVREVPCRRTALTRRRIQLALAAAAAQALVPCTVIALGVATVCAIASPPRMRGFVSSKGDFAKATVIRLAYEAYPAWLDEHRGQARPPRLAELSAYMNSKDLHDPWGTGYLLVTQAGVSPGVLAISAGEDRTFYTADDLRSDR